MIVESHFVRINFNGQKSASAQFNNLIYASLFKRTAKQAENRNGKIKSFGRFCNELMNVKKNSTGILSLS